MAHFRKQNGSTSFLATDQQLSVLDGEDPLIPAPDADDVELVIVGDDYSLDDNGCLTVWHEGEDTHITKGDWRGLDDAMVAVGTVRDQRCLIVILQT